jgi:hypothetical protein
LFYVCPILFVCDADSHPIQQLTYETNRQNLRYTYRWDVAAEIGLPNTSFLLKNPKELTLPVFDAA